MRQVWDRDTARRGPAAAGALDRTAFADVCGDTGGLTVPETARLVLDRLGEWPAVPSAARAPSHPEPSRHASLAPGGGPGARTGSAGAMPVLWLWGPVRVGKSTVGYENFRQTVRDGVTSACIDVRQIGFLRPAADGDPGGHALKAADLAALHEVFRAAGARCLIVSGEAGHPRPYDGLFPATALTFCRLSAGPERLTERTCCAAEDATRSSRATTCGGRPRRRCAGSPCGPPKASAPSARTRSASTPTQSRRRRRPGPCGPRRAAGRAVRTVRAGRAAAAKAPERAAAGPGAGGGHPAPPLAGGGCYFESGAILMFLKRMPPPLFSNPM
ncbi:hypothetical protein Arub01_58890 [Actinomadura rubrobrunea]|uniref:Uncharacterized protein n=1 Tax=Actinomadura rubrobrunea TaxID=115335 RepID=A0A9W6Q2N3_9ACTN|nr:hypothetical protein [Actinomadura rubrobrunea]GLW67646.1 hypothetical protein Arub01_58890 [Actinomadura rubrobrunea]